MKKSLCILILIFSFANCNQNSSNDAVTYLGLNSLAKKAAITSTKVVSQEDNTKTEKKSVSFSIEPKFQNLIYVKKNTSTTDSKVSYSETNSWKLATNKDNLKNLKVGEEISIALMKKIPLGTKKIQSTDKNLSLESFMKKEGVNTDTTISNFKKFVVAISKDKTSKELEIDTKVIEKIVEDTSKQGKISEKIDFKKSPDKFKSEVFEKLVKESVKAVTKKEPELPTEAVLKNLLGVYTNQERIVVWHYGKEDGDFLKSAKEGKTNTEKANFLCKQKARSIDSVANAKNHRMLITTYGHTLKEFVTNESDINKPIYGTKGIKIADSWKEFYNTSKELKSSLKNSITGLTDEEFYWTSLIDFNSKISYIPNNCTDSIFEEFHSNSSSLKGAAGSLSNTGRSRNALEQKGKIPFGTISCDTKLPILCVSW